MKRILLTYTLAFILLPVYGGEGGSSPAEKKSLLIDYVDPFIGTTNFGTTNPGAICPNGITFLFLCTSYCAEFCRLN